VVERCSNVKELYGVKAGRPLTFLFTFLLTRC